MGYVTGDLSIDKPKSSFFGCFDLAVVLWSVSRSIKVCSLWTYYVNLTILMGYTCGLCIL